MTDHLVSRLLEAIGEAERLASFREELPGMDFGITDSKSWHTKGCGYRQSEWMEACDCDVPSSVLRRCAADRKLIERHGPFCDCGARRPPTNPDTGQPIPHHYDCSAYEAAQILAEAYGLEVTE